MYIHVCAGSEWQRVEVEINSTAAEREGTVLLLTRRDGTGAVQESVADKTELAYLHIVSLKIDSRRRSLSRASDGVAKERRMCGSATEVTLAPQSIPARHHSDPHSITETFDEVILYLTRQSVPLPSVRSATYCVPRPVTTLST